MTRKKSDEQLVPCRSRWLRDGTDLVDLSMNLFLVLATIAACVVLFTGCANQRGLININMATRLEPVTAAPQPTAVAPVASAPSAPKSTTYTVLKGDCLWKIAGKPGVYGDCFMWPALWKENRWEVPNPNLIEVGQALRVRHNDERSLVRQFASDWPDR